MKKNQCIEVIFDDIVQDETWVSEKEAAKLPVDINCRVLGYFLKKTKRALFISGMVCKNKDRNQIIIPNGCIKKIRKLK